LERGRRLPRQCLEVGTPIYRLSMANNSAGTVITRAFLRGDLWTKPCANNLRSIHITVPPLHEGKLP